VNNKALLGASAAVLVALGGLTGTAIYLLKKRGSTHTVTLSRLPAESVVVVRGQMAPLRSFGPAQALQRFLTGTTPTQGPDVTREARETYRGLVQACGFDPWDNAQAFSFGVDRAATEARNASAMVLYADGRFTEAQARRCAEYVLGRTQQALRAQEVDGRTVYAVTRAGAEPDARAPALWFRDNVVMLTERPFVQTALGLASGSVPGLRDDAPVAQMLGVLGGANVLEVAGDVAQLRRQNPQSAGEFVDGLVRDNPAQPNLTLAREVQTVGFSMQVAGGGVSMRLRFALPQEAQAAAFGAALQGALVARRGEVLRVLEEGQSQLRAAQLVVSLTAPEMRQRIDEVDAGITTARQVIEAVQATAEARHAVVTLNIAPPQVQSLERAARAASDVAQLMMRDSPRRRFPVGMPGDEGERAPVRLPGPGLALPGLDLPPPGAAATDAGAVQSADAAAR
jgi:hypothetical protein